MKKVLSLMILVLLVSCKSGKSELQTKAENFVNMQNAASGAGPSPSAKTWSIEKLETNEGGNWAVFKRVTNSTGAVSYASYDLDSYNNESAYATYEANVMANYNGPWFVLASPDGTGLFNGVIHGANIIGGAYIPMTATEISSYQFEETSGSGKDLELLGAKLENQLTDSWARGLSENFGMSDERSHEVAKIVQNWNKLKKQRNVTSNDWNVLSQKLIGIDYQKASSIIEGAALGNSEDLDALIEKAADFNGVTPEQMELVLKDLILNN